MATAGSSAVSAITTPTATRHIYADRHPNGYADQHADSDGYGNQHADSYEHGDHRWDDHSRHYHDTTEPGKDL